MARSGRPCGAALLWAVGGCALYAGPGSTAQPLVVPEPAQQAAGQPGGTSPPGRMTSVRVPLEVSLKINGKFLGTISVAVDTKGEGEIDAKRLIDLVATVIDAKLKAALVACIAGRPRVEFTALDVDGFTLRFDSLALEAVGTLAANASIPAVLRFGYAQDVPIPAGFDQPETVSAGVNIGASQRYDYGHKGGFEGVRVDLDAIANIGGFDGVTMTGGASYDGTRWRRREFRLTHDLFAKALRATIGEFTPSSTSFQGSGRILGIGLERAYSTIRPFQNTRPIGQQEFTLDRASSVDVIVNQIRVQTIRLAPGRYDIGDFPFAAGSNQVQLVVEDVGGRREIVNFDVFNTTSLLTPGITEFGGAIGARERDQLRYGGSPAATGYVYHGLSDTTTLGLNGQATSRAVQLGGVAVLGTPLGFFQLETAASKSLASGNAGYAISLDYRGDFSIRGRDDLRIAGSLNFRSPTFQDAFARDTLNLRALETALQVQWLAPLDISTGVSAGYTMARRGAPSSYRGDMTIGRSFGRVGINGTASRIVFDNGRGNNTRFAIGLSVRLGRRDTFNARLDTGSNRREVEIGRSPEGRLGEVSGMLRYTEDRDTSAISGRLAYVNNRFDLVLNHNRIERAGTNGPPSNVSDWNVRTFLGFAGGTFALGRSVDEGFVVAPVHRTLHGAQASIVSGDRIIARSGLFGPALVPIGRAYGASHYDVKVDPLPVGYDLGTGSINIFPGYGPGYRSVIGSENSFIAVGFLVSAEGPIALISGTIEPVDPARRKTWKERGFFTNRAGRFVADRLAPGRYRLALPGGASAQFTVPAAAEGVVDVGTLRVTS